MSGLESLKFRLFYPQEKISPPLPVTIGWIERKYVLGWQQQHCTGPLLAASLERPRQRGSQYDSFSWTSNQKIMIVAARHSTDLLLYGGPWVSAAL
jgi:hypothetical protein